MEKLKVGIIGLGRIAALYEDDRRARRYYTHLTHAGSYAKDPRVEIVCGSDINSVRRARFGRDFGVRGLYKDYRRMFKENRLDIVSICTGPEAHYEMLKEACKHVKVIFCEKPFTAGLREIKKVIRLQKEAKARITINLYRQYDASHAAVRDILKSGKLGKIQRVNCFYGKGLRNMGIHLLAYVTSIIGFPEKVKTLGRKHFATGEEPSYDVYLEFAGRVPGMLQACDFNRFRIFEIDFICERGRIQILDEGLTIKQFRVRDNRAETGARELFETEGALKSTVGSALAGAVDHLVDMRMHANVKPVYPPERYARLQSVVEEIERQGRGF